MKINTFIGYENFSECMQEIKNLIKVRSEYCVQYMGQWEEKNMYYIRMELCSHSLQNILQNKLQVFVENRENP